MQDLQSKWDTRYSNNNDAPLPCQVLREHAHLLPESGKALDLACGMGGNALFLAARGLETTAWDLSPVGITKLRQHALKQSVTIDAQSRDVIAAPPQANSYDVIVVSYFLERDLFPALLASLKPGGLFIYETFIQDKPEGIGPSNPEYLLEQNELLTRCQSLVIRSYREEGQLGDMEKGARNVALLVGQKPVDAL